MPEPRLDAIVYRSPRRRSARNSTRAPRRAATGVLLLALVTGATGCAGAEVSRESGVDRDADMGDGGDSPTPPGLQRLDATAILDAVAERGRRIDRFDAQLDLSLRRADGAAADLAGSLRMSKPDRMRLRSTKFGFLVCDVVLIDGDAWAALSPVVRDQARASADATHDLLRVLGSLLGWRAGRDGELVIVSEEEHHLTAEAREPSGTRLQWTWSRNDGRILEVRRMDGDDAIGVLHCSGHRFVDGVPIPCTLRFESRTGTIDVQVRRPRINGTQPADAFTAPPGAERIE